MYDFKDLVVSKDGKHKYEVTLLNTETGRNKTIKFGQAGADDFTITKDKEQKDRYIQRHEKREDWTKSGVATSGFWAKHLLWHLPSIKASLADTKKKYFKN